MPWIDVIHEDDATGDLQAAYEQMVGKRGRSSNVLKIQSLHPKSMVAHLNLYMAIMFDRDGLTREQAELIGTAVSATNRCPYCVRHHSQALNKYWRDHNRTVSYALDVAGFPLPPQDRAMVDYAIKLTRTPTEMNEADVTTLRDNGFDDRRILLINQVASYFNYVNRSVLGLGVEIEPNTERFDE